MCKEKEHTDVQLPKEEQAGSSDKNELSPEEVKKRLSGRASEYFMFTEDDF